MHKGNNKLIETKDKETPEYESHKTTDQKSLITKLPENPAE